MDCDSIMVDIPDVDDVSSSVMEDAKDGLVGGISVGVGHQLAGDLGAILGSAVGGAMVGGQNGKTITVSQTSNIVGSRVANL